jgi:hypothetical protein
LHSIGHCRGAGLCLAVLATLFSSFAGGADLQSEASRKNSEIDYSMAMESRQAVNRQGEYSLAEYTALGELNWKPARGWRIKGQVRAVSERKLDVIEGDRFLLDEGFIEYESPTCNYRLGTQQVVWGVADKLRVLDIIHPFDFRENVFGDQVRSRLPLFMLNGECGGDTGSLQWLIIPQSRTNDRPSRQGRFAEPTVLDAISARNIPIAEGRQLQERHPDDWSLALRWLSRLGDADVTLNLFHGWEPDEILRLDRTTPAVRYVREASRLTVIGGSFSVPVEKLVLKGEATASPNATRYFINSPGLIESQRAREYRILLALDYQTENWFFTTQFLNQQARTAETSITPYRQQAVTFAAKRDFLQGRLSTKTFVAHDLTNPAQYFAFEGLYEIDSQWQGSVALDYFRGDSVSFGRFNSESRFILGLRYNFR